jgi:alkaline phosphatase D
VSASCFLHGVASGDVTSDAVVLWTRLTVDDTGTAARDEAHVVDWSISRSETANVVQSGTVPVGPASDHCLHVEVDGLQPATDYVYAFEHAGSRAEGRVRTLPERADHLRFVVVCCSRRGWPGFELFDQVVAERPAFVLHLGDSIYEIGETAPDGTTTDPPHDCHTLDDYRRRHRQYRSDARLQRMFAAVPVLAVWDDHEVADNAPDPGGAARRRAGQQAWRDWTPTRAGNADEPLDRSLAIEGLVDLALVDSRFGGRSADDVDGPGDADEATGHILAERQWVELDRVAEQSTAPWFVVANQVQVSPMTLVVRPARSWPPWRRVVNPDQWDGYPADRDRLASIVRRAAGEPIVLSGDLHSAWSRVWRDADGPVAHEYTCPSISGTTYGEAVRERLPLPIGVTERWLRTINRGIDHLDLDTHGYLVCDVTPELFTTTLVTIDGQRRTFRRGRTNDAAGVSPRHATT